VPTKSIARDGLAELACADSEMKVIEPGVNRSSCVWTLVWTTHPSGKTVRDNFDNLSKIIEIIELSRIV
jgi:hypothetical protein